MNKTTKKYFAGLLTLLMVFSFLPLAAFADTVAPKIIVKLEVRGDSGMGTIYNENLVVEAGENAFNLIKVVMNENKIPFEYNDEWKFVTGVNGLKQMDKGPNSDGSIK